MLLRSHGSGDDRPRRVARCRHVLALALLVPLVGCKTWETARVSPRDAIAAAQPSSVRVTTVYGQVVTVRNPIFVNDSLVSGTAPPPGLVVVPPRTGVRESDVNSIDVPSFSLRRSLAFAGAIAFVSVTWARTQGVGLGREPRDPPLPKDGAFGLTAAFRLLVGSQ